MSNLIHVKVGYPDFGDGAGPWIPTDEEIKKIEDAVKEQLIGNTRVVATHFGVELVVYDV